MSRPTINCDLLVIGSGIAGMAAALFAANRGINIVQAGMAGELTFASGLLDLMGVHPVKESRIWDDPVRLTHLPRPPSSGFSHRTAL